ncbi:MAG: NAD(P)-dependent oxidoreductase [Sphaerochaetaceae bacterium]|jgi:3-hydroxyisobutyrate dehydrogenase
MKRIGLIGTGNMGLGIAQNLLKKEGAYNLTVFTRDTQRGKEVSETLEKKGAHITHSLKDLFSQVDTLLLCLTDSVAVEHILIEEGGLLSYKDTTTVKTVIDFSTSHPESTKKVGKMLNEASINLLDTPMTGSKDEAEKGIIRLLSGGDESVFNSQKDIFDAISASAAYCGPQGSAHLVKLANNYMAVLNQTISAQVALVLEKEGIPLDVYRTFISQSGGNSAGFKSILDKIEKNNFDVKFELGLAAKDVRYASEFFPSPIADELRTLFLNASEASFKDKDIAEIYNYLKTR